MNNLLAIIYGCHQRADRSFIICNHQFPICARCTGIMVGNIIAIIVPFFIRTPLWLIVFVIPLIVDGTIQRLTKYESNNFKRFITGLLGGFGGLVFFIELGVLCYYLGYNLGLKFR